LNEYRKFHFANIRRLLFNLLTVITIVACSTSVEIPTQSISASPIAGIPVTGLTATATPQATASPTSQPGISHERYQDPDGLFSVVVPIHWHAAQEQGYGLLTDPDNAIKAYVLSVPGNDIEKGITAAWAIVDPSFKLQPVRVDQPPAPEGIEQEVKITYDSGDPQRLVTGKGDLVQSRVYVVLMDGGVSAFLKRDSQVTTVEEPQINAVKKLDLSGEKPKALDDQILSQFDTYIRDAMQRASVPGAEVAVIQDGKVIYMKAFGVRTLDKPDPVSTDTLMMIGSTTKAMTTMMMASLVDSGKLSWDTPAVQVYPSFAVADPSLSAQITIRNLVCNCSGVPRKDVELIFQGGQISAKDVIASLQSYQFYTPFGEAFQYSNQMVATGGYIAAIAGSGDPNPDHLQASYETLMQKRIFDPIGMTSSTFSTEKATASGNYALPHGADLTGHYQPLPLVDETFTKPGEPAGGLWSNIKDMSRYLITQMNQGVTPDGNRIVSTENLNVTWTPQVQTSATAGYALGWDVSHFEGLRAIEHSGGTTGFATFVSFLPEAGLGVVVLSNNRPDGDAFVPAVTVRLYELAYGLAGLHEKTFDYSLAKQKKAFEAQAAMLQPKLDPAKVAPFLGRYQNDALGDITLAMQGDQLVLQATGFSTPLSETKQQGVYLFYTGLVAGVPLVFAKDADGKLALMMNTPLGNYTFTPAAGIPVTGLTATDTPQPTAGPTSQPGILNELYQDPDGLFSVVIPTHWKTTQEQGYGLLTDPDNTIKAYVLSVPGNDIEKGITAAWKMVDPSFKLQSAQVDQPPAPEGVEKQVMISYDSGDPLRVVTGKGELVAGRIYVVLVDGKADAIQKRITQVGIVQTIQINAARVVDLTNVMPETIDGQITSQWEAYIRDAMKRASVPGVQVAIVQNGKVVYMNAFGVKELGKPDPLTTDTLMMIGSVTKSMTTLMMATLVDDGKLSWDTPAVQLYPDFAVADPQLSNQITIRNLVCNCSGVPRRDLELSFHGSLITPQEMIGSLRTFQFFTPFGEVFQYSNQMVATGGYISAIAGSGDANPDHLQANYEAQMQQRVFDPIGMPNSTFFLDKVQSSGNFSLPHTAYAARQMGPIPLGEQKIYLPGEPAGALWTNIKDMARYMITQLNDGVSPDGKRVVSAENLNVTRTSQVQVSATVGYGLGWAIENYKGAQLIWHNGDAAGFTSDMAFMPDDQLGIMVISNSSAGVIFNQALRNRLLELAFGQPEEYDATFSYKLAAQEKEFKGLAALLKDDVDWTAATPFLGSYHNDALGDVTLTNQNGKLLLQAGDFTSELQETVQKGTYLITNGVLTSLPLQFTQDASGKPEIVLSVPPDIYQLIRNP
jgi:CubicO group peptidase (beta-lactamase class C family)